MAGTDTIEHAATSTPSTITYDSAHHSIRIEVVVSLPPGGTDVQIEASPVSVPGGTWTLNWNLVVTTPGLQANFGNPGIILSKNLPPQVTVVVGPTSAEGGVWTTTLGNTVLNVNAFSYKIVVDWLRLEDLSVATTRTVQDPTIAVVKDPIG